MTNFDALYQDYGEYNILFNQLNLPSPSVDHAWRKTKKIIQDTAVGILQNTHRKMRVGDLGCGNGALLIRIAELTKDLENQTDFQGFDLSRAFVNYGGQAAVYKKLTNITFEKFNFETEKISQKFDILICSEVLEHLHKPEEILRKMFTMLNPGGTLILTTPNSQNLIKYPFSFLKTIISRKNSQELAQTLTLKEQSFVLAELEQHLYVYSHHELEQALKRVGFRVVGSPRSTTFFGGPFLDNHPILFALTLIFDRLIDLLPLPQIGWDTIFVATKD